MNYFELINKCLVELNYKTCDKFTDLVQNDHSKIKNILNIVNTEVCGFDNWNFLLRKQQVSLAKNTGEFINTIPGRIHSLYIDNTKYDYISDFDLFFLNKEPSNTYSVFNDKILLPIFSEEKTVEVIFYTNCCAQNSQDVDQSLMTLEDDVSLIPDPFVEPILVYGTCLRLKGNTEYSKFSYWFGMYKDSLANLRARICTDALDTPMITINRR